MLSFISGNLRYLAKAGAYLRRILIGDPQLRGKRLGQLIVAYLLEYAFEMLGQTKVQLTVFDWNLGATKCDEKAGFRINPDKKAARIVNG